MPEDNYTVDLSTTREVRAGKDVTVYCYGAMVPVVTKAAEEAASQGIETNVIDLRTLLPLDEESVLGVPRVIRLPGVNQREPADPAIQFDREPVTIPIRQEIAPGFLEEMRDNGITHLVVRIAPWRRYTKVVGVEAAAA